MPRKQRNVDIHSFTQPHTSKCVCHSLKDSTAILIAKAALFNTRRGVNDEWVRTNVGRQRCIRSNKLVVRKGVSCFLLAVNILQKQCVFDLLSAGAIRAEFPTTVLCVGYVWSIVFRVCILEDVSCETRRNHNTTSLKSVHFSFSKCPFLFLVSTIRRHS